MSATTAARLRTDAVRSAPEPAGDVPARLADQAEDFAALLLQALDDALNAMAHPAPDQYLHLVAAQRRCRPPATRSDAGRPADAVAGNAAVARELGAHLAFDILNCARRYGALLGTIGDYALPVETSGRPQHRRNECALAP